MKIAHNYFVYILECNDTSYYTGVTNDLDRRLWEHNNDKKALCYTFKRRPVILRYSQRFQDITQAIEFEKQIKGWSRKKKEALFNEDWETIKRLAKSHSTPSSTSSD